MYFYARVLSQEGGELGTIPFHVTEIKTHIPSGSQRPSPPHVRHSAGRCFQPKRWGASTSDRKMKHLLAQRKSFSTAQTSLHPLESGLGSLSPAPISQTRAKHALENKWDPDLLSLTRVLLSLDYKVQVILSSSSDLVPGACRLRGSSGLNAHVSGRPESCIPPSSHLLAQMP